MTQEESSKAFGNTGGFKLDKGKVRYDLVPPEAEEALARVLMHNAKSEGGRYPDRNWEEGMSYVRAYAAVRRHLAAWLKGEDIDPDSGNLHINHAFCMLAFLVTYIARGMNEFDDRPNFRKPLNVPPVSPHIQEQLDREELARQQSHRVEVVFPSFEEVCDELDKITQAESEAAMPHFHEINGGNFPCYSCEDNKTPDTLMQEVDSHAESCYTDRGESMPMPYDALNTQELQLDEEDIKVQVANQIREFVEQNVESVDKYSLKRIGCHACDCQNASCPIQHQHPKLEH